jgi:hypothetical protein
MLSYTSSRNLYGSLTNSAESGNLTLGDSLINEAIRFYCSSNGGKWWFLEKVTTQSTVASQQAYILPAKTRKVIDLYVTVGTTVYSPIPVEDATVWKRILQSQLGTSDRALFYYRQGNSVLLAPTPATSGNTLTIRVRKNISDLSIADYTTGTVTMTNGDETVTGAGTTFTIAMEGRYIRATSGDMQWYEIADFTSTTALELVADYEGETVAGSNFIIGQISPLPEAYQELPVIRAASMYWRKEGDTTRTRLLTEQADDLYQMMLEEAQEKVEGAYIPPIQNLVFRDPNIPEPSISTSDFT